jgi:hypothetical protein
MSATAVLNCTATACEQEVLNETVPNFSGAA